MINCPICHTELDEKVSICPVCGYDLKFVREHSESGRDHGEASQHTQPQKEHGNKTYIVLACVALVTFVAVMGMMAAGKKQNAGSGSGKLQDQAGQEYAAVGAIPAEMQGSFEFTIPNSMIISKLVVDEDGNLTGKWDDYNMGFILSSSYHGTAHVLEGRKGTMFLEIDEIVTDTPTGTREEQEDITVEYEDASTYGLQAGDELVFYPPGYSFDSLPDVMREEMIVQAQEENGILKNGLYFLKRVGTFICMD